MYDTLLAVETSENESRKIIVTNEPWDDEPIDDLDQIKALSGSTLKWTSNKDMPFIMNSCLPIKSEVLYFKYRFRREYSLRSSLAHGRRT